MYPRLHCTLYTYSAHTSAYMRTVFEQEGVFPPICPAKSPDLSAIENVWGLIKTRLEKYSLNAKYFQSLNKNILKRINADISNNGARMKYWFDCAVVLISLLFSQILLSSGLFPFSKFFSLLLILFSPGLFVMFLAEWNTKTSSFSLRDTFLKEKVTGDSFRNGAARTMKCEWIQSMPGAIRSDFLRFMISSGSHAVLWIVHCHFDIFYINNLWIIDVHTHWCDKYISLTMFLYSNAWFFLSN